MTKDELLEILSLGEDYYTEFKEKVNASLVRELVAMANASGGRIFIGIDDKNRIKGVDVLNAVLSQIQDLANNCDPAVKISIEPFEKIIIVHVSEGTNKPYSCSDGFYLRVGPNSQKLTRDEIIQFLKREGKVRFEQLTNERFSFKRHFDINTLNGFLQLSGTEKRLDNISLLDNLGVLHTTGENPIFNNAGILFFTKETEYIYEHIAITCVPYDGTERIKVLNRKDYNADIISNIEDAIRFVTKELKVRYEMVGEARRKEIYEIPIDAIREAVINAVSHRDYFEQGAHTTVEIFDNRAEITNPGGLVSGFDLAFFGKKSIRRNPLISGLLYRARYVENLGTGINKIKSLVEETSPGREVQFLFDAQTFRVVFMRDKETGIVNDAVNDAVKKRLAEELKYVLLHGGIALPEIIEKMKVKRATAQRDMKYLKDGNLVEFSGAPKTGKYILTDLAKERLSKKS